MPGFTVVVWAQWGFMHPAPVARIATIGHESLRLLAEAERSGRLRTPGHRRLVAVIFRKTA